MRSLSTHHVQVLFIWPTVQQYIGRASVVPHPTLHLIHWRVFFCGGVDILHPTSANGGGVVCGIVSCCRGGCALRSGEGQTRGMLFCCVAVCFIGGAVVSLRCAVSCILASRPVYVLSTVERRYRRLPRARALGSGRISGVEVPPTWRCNRSQHNLVWFSR